MKIKLNENQELTGATTRHGSPIPTYDDREGDLFIHRDSMGVTGIVRAQTWATAYSIVEDELLPSADEEAFEKTWKEMSDDEQACWNEAYGHRPNGPGGPTPDVDQGIYAKDVNGDTLDILTQEMLDEWGITLEVTTDWDAIADTVLSLDWTDAVGVWIPHLFCTNVTDKMLKAQDECVQECIKRLIPVESVHNYEHYWEDWSTILDRFEWRRSRLHQNGDLWWVDTKELEKLSDCYGIDEDDIATHIFGG